MIGISYLEEFFYINKILQSIQDGVCNNYWTNLSKTNFEINRQLVKSVKIGSKKLNKYSFGFVYKE